MPRIHVCALTMIEATAARIGMRTCVVRTGKGSTFASPWPGAELDLPGVGDLPAALLGGRPDSLQHRDVEGVVVLRQRDADGDLALRLYGSERCRQGGAGGQCGHEQGTTHEGVSLSGWCVRGFERHANVEIEDCLQRPRQ